MGGAESGSNRAETVGVGTDAGTNAALEATARGGCEGVGETTVRPEYDISWYAEAGIRCNPIRTSANIGGDRREEERVCCSCCPRQGRWMG